MLHYHEATEKQVQDLVTINTIPMTVFSHRLIQRFLKRKKRSAIITLSSNSAELAYTQYHVYTATKAFDDFLSRCLSYEYPQFDIIALRPSEVSTPMTYNREIDIYTVTAEQCV